MKKFFLSERFNSIEASIIGAVAIAISDSEWVLAIIISVVGVLIASLLGFWFSRSAKDRQWQELADRGQKMAAIKEYRTVYNSTLKEALITVDAYLGTNHQ